MGTRADEGADAGSRSLPGPESSAEDIRADLAAWSEPEALAQRISDLATAWAGATIGTVFLRRLWNDRDRFVPAAVTGATLAAFPELPALNPARVNPDSLFGGIFARQQPCLIPDVQEHSAFHGLPRPHPPVRGLLATPLFDQQGVSRGVLVLGHREAHRFAERQYQAVLRLADLAGARLAELRLIEPTAREA